MRMIFCRIHEYLAVIQAVQEEYLRWLKGMGLIDK